MSTMVSPTGDDLPRQRQLQKIKLILKVCLSNTHAVKHSGSYEEIFIYVIILLLDLKPVFLKTLLFFV